MNESLLQINTNNSTTIRASQSESQSLLTSSEMWTFQTMWTAAKLHIGQLRRGLFGHQIFQLLSKPWNCVSFNCHY